MQPLVISYGGGVDSTAMLVGLYQRGIIPDLILFADVGSEWPETYEFIEKVLRPWLSSVGFPDLVTVRNPPPKRVRTASFIYTTLEEQCIATKQLPSLAYGGRSCSSKWKHEPMDKYVREFAKETLARGDKVTRAIGYDAGPKDSKRCWNMTETTEWSYWYPLRDWGWDRERCQKEISAAGMEVPRKSSCFFCPASKPDEITELLQKHPELAERIVEMERNAAPNLIKIEGLWRKKTKTKPGSMTEFIRSAQRGLP